MTLAFSTHTKDIHENVNAMRNRQNTQKRKIRFRNWDDKYKFYRDIQVEGVDEIRIYRGQDLCISQAHVSGGLFTWNTVQTIGGPRVVRRIGNHENIIESENDQKR